MKRPLVKQLLCGSVLSAGLILSGSQVVVSAEPVPGTVPPGYQDPTPNASRPEAASGLKVYYRNYGFYELSVDAKGSNDASHTVRVKKPHANAKVVKAYLLAATYGNVAIGNGAIALNGKPVNWFASETNAISSSSTYFHSYLADVTSIVKKKIDNKQGAGTLKFRIEELTSNSSIDGEILVVVFENKKLPEKRTVALLFGGQQLAGDRFEITLKKAIDKTDPDSLANMGLGISFSHQPASPSQYSIIDVNGKRLTTSAGGEDDGGAYNGGLITVGGIGDKTKNPANPNATPTGPRDDDELYNLKPFLAKTAKTIYVDTQNPSDDDNIFFGWFELTAKGDINKDTDGDGLLDTWEKKGYDHDGDGKIDVNLKKWGANWKKKDIFICYAWMNKSGSETKSHKPSAAVLNAVKNAFASAPVNNPNGTKGIAIHFRSKGGVPHDDDLNPVWDEFDAIMNPLVSDAERKICHRMINGHGYSGTSSSGLSRGIGASDFIETLGLFSSNPGTLVQRAGTIMHELGHNLGLRHGNVDDENYKPNHLSIMSYHWQLDWLIKNGSPLLDYERHRLQSLDETNLDERKGLDRIGGDGPIAPYAVRWYSGGTYLQKNSGANKNVNWDNTGPATNNPVAVNLNNANGNTVLPAGESEWAKIVFDGGDVGPGAPSKKVNRTFSADALKELTYEQYLDMKRKRIEVK